MRAPRKAWTSSWRPSSSHCRCEARQSAPRETVAWWIITWLSSCATMQTACIGDGHGKDQGNG
ncbi:hypothetical protein ACFFX0_20220 [Citricoccus parietis]|uniref:Uncharacterized protein n=1 Tax=Citricoccus parietis TaxID=592307 RepID=A0ABV5G386_9MICC